jgi:Tfp pilus assembly protein PilF
MMNPAPKPIRTPRLNISILALPLYAMGLYANTIGNSFVFDDIHQILNNPWIKDFSHLREIFTTQVWAFAGRDSNYYRPLMHVLYAVLYFPFGPQAWVFHLANVILHGVATLLVFLIASRLLAIRTVGAVGFSPSAALASALIFAAHPIHTEAVAWISSLPDLACTVLFLTSVLLFLRAIDVSDRWTKYHGLGAVCYLACVLFKEPGITLPAVIALLDLVTRPRDRNAKFWASRYGFLFIAGCAYMTLRFFALEGIVPTAADSSPNPSHIISVMGSAVWWYFTLLVAPVHLNVFHTFDSATSLPPTAALVGFPLALGIAVWRRSLPWTSALGMFMLPLIPAIYAPVLLPGLDNPWAERYVYLSSVGFVIGLGALFDSVADLRAYARRIAPVVLAVVLVVFSIATIRRNDVWKNDLTLWTDAVKKSPNAWAAHSYLGYALFTNGDIDGAIGRYRTAITMKPDFADAHLNLGVALASTGHHEAAVAAYNEAIRLSPRRAMSYANLSVSLAALGYMAQALKEADKAVELDPLCGKAHGARGVSLGNMGLLREAAASFQRAIELDPNDANSMANLEKARRLWK